jgi:hypothetical protein
MKNIWPYAPAGISLLDAIVRATPVPADYAVILKLPAAVVCLAIVLYAKPPARNAVAMRLLVSGALLLIVYCAFTLSSLHDNPLFYQPGDNSIVGLWLTDEARIILERNGWTVARLHDSYGPANWETIYSRGSQIARCVLLSILYASSFACVTLGLKRLSQGR